MSNRRPSRARAAVRHRAASENRLAALRFAAIAAVVVGVGFLYYKVSSSHPALDKQTLCPSDPSSVTVLLVDVTDPLNVQQRQDFMNQLVRLENTIPRYGKLIVTQVAATGNDLLSPVIVRCNPGTAADENETTGNPAAVQKLWEEQFDTPLKAAFDRIATASSAEQSPILESIQSVALTEFQKPAVQSKPRSLVVASDLLQNTNAVSFYKGLPDPDEFIEAPAFRHVRTDLRGVKIELWMLERTDAASTQPRSLIDLWDRLITEQGGLVERVYRVNG